MTIDHLMPVQAAAAAGSSSSRYANNPASDVTTDPRNCTIRRRSKSSRMKPDSDSPAGFAIAASPIQDKLLIAISESLRALSKSARHPGNAGLYTVIVTLPLRAEK
jgi:hypothetical protein